MLNKLYALLNALCSGKQMTLSVHVAWIVLFDRSCALYG